MVEGTEPEPISGTERTQFGELSSSGSDIASSSASSLALGTEPAAPTTEADPPLRRGEAVGRYTVLDEVGRGAMGVVYAAYDPELDRRIALKLLHTSHGRDSAQRLVREARALARFTHPNVVTIHDVGAARGRAFIATEFIEGETLHDWLRSDPSIAEILAALRTAGQGLAAAHRAGVVHRDFKPHNVMVTPQARVVVMDFGLARRAGDATEISSTGDHQIGGPSLEGLVDDSSLGSDVDLTTTGAVLGTPAYMSLEQHRGRPADAASDQFSFCVTGFEALVGHRPFEGGNRMAIAMAVDKGRRHPWPPNNPIPARIRQAIDRGLAADPAQRWPDMESLLAEFEPEAPGRRLGPVALGVGVVGLVASGVVGFWLAQRDVDPCAEVSEVVSAEVWSPAARSKLDRAIRGTELAYAGATADRVIAHLDAYAGAWATARTDVCVAHHVDQVQSVQVHDARVRCLERSLLGLDATIDALSLGDARMVGRATDAVYDLPSIDRCADVEALLDEVPPPDDPRAAKAVDGARRLLVEADAQRMAGELAQARVRIDRALELARADAPGYRALFAELALADGLLRIDRGEFGEAAEALERAHLDARRSGQQRVAVRSAVTLVYIVGYRLARYDEASLWARLAHAELDRFGTEQPEAAELVSREGILHGRQGRFVEARDHYLRAKALYEQLGFTDTPGYDAMFTNLGLVCLNLGEVELARAHLLEAQRRNEARYGASHPKVAAALTNLATATIQLGDLDEGLRLAEAAVRAAATSLAPGHVGIGQAHQTVALAALARGDLELGQDAIDRALELESAALGNDHPAVAELRTQRAELLRLRGHPIEAIDDAELAQAQLGARFGDADWRTVEATSVLAMARLAADEPALARALAEAVLATVAHGSARSSLPRGRAWLVLAAVDASANPDRVAGHQTQARAELDSSRGLGLHLLRELPSVAE